MGAQARRTVADHLFDEAELLLRIGNSPDAVFFLNARGERPADFLFEREHRLHREAADVDVDGAFRGDGVDGRAALDRADREGRLRVLRGLEVGDLCARNADRVNGARRGAEGAVAVAAGALHREAPAMRADGAVKNAAHVRVVDGKEPVDGKSRFVEEVL